MSKRGNPVGIEVLGGLDHSQFEEDLSRLGRRVKVDDEDKVRMEWKRTSKEVRELIDGDDKRKQKPWADASETSVPLLKKLLRRWKPSIYNLVAMADPLCSFHAGTPDAADLVPTHEQFFSWLVLRYMDGTLDDLQIMLEHTGGDRGMGYLLCEWDYRTELETRVIVSKNLFPQGLDPETDPADVAQAIAQLYELGEEHREQLFQVAQQLIAGAPYAVVTYQNIVADKPRITSPDPLDVIVPANSEACHEADYVAIRYRLNENDLRKGVADGRFDESAVAALLEKRPATGTEDTHVTGEEEPVNQADDPRFTVYRVYCHLDYNGDGIKERCVMWRSFDKDITLALFPYPFSFRYWPIFRFDFEKVSKKPYRSRGIGHLLLEQQKQLNKQVRARADAIDIQLAPVFQQRVTGGNIARSIKWGPGKVIPVQEVGDFAPVQTNPMNLVQYLQAEGEISNSAEQTIGSTINDLQATGRRLERRSATEVQTVAQSGSGRGRLRGR